VGGEIIVNMANVIDTSAIVAGSAEGNAVAASHLRAFIEVSSTAALIFDVHQQVLYANAAAYSFARSLNPDMAEEGLRRIGDWHPELVAPAALHLAQVRGSWIGEVVLVTASTQQKVLLVQITAIGPDRTAPFGMSVRDISLDYARETELRQRNAELEVANGKLKGAQEQVVQSEKLASIGQLAAGVAHEINNPIGYVNSNLSTLQSYATKLLTAIETLASALARKGGATTVAEVQEIRGRYDIDFLAVDLPQLLTESREGIDRVCKIVRDLKDFSRNDRGEAWVSADVHRGLESTLNIVWNELKYKAQIVKTFGDIPPIECLPSELNQVFMNILMNAGQAIKDRGVITVSTGHADGKIWVAIGDDGEGIPADVLPRIFDPFFTTKPVGSGTGLGLSISYGIVAKHHGTIEITSVPGQGTLLRIELPIEQPH
jgi:two-component system, NtrC family, sensor kinase